MRNFGICIPPTSVGGAAKDSQAAVYQKHRSLLNSQEEI